MKTQNQVRTKSQILEYVNSLSNEDLIKEFILCKRSFRHFLQYAIIYSEDYMDYVSFADLAYEKQLEFIDTVIKDHYVIINKSRQIGISTITQAFVAWLILFNAEYSVGVVSKLGSEATKFVSLVKEFVDNFPLRFTGSLKEEDRYELRNQRKIKLKNGSYVVSAAVSMHNPGNTLRGEALNMLIIDEAAFISKISDAYTGMLPAISKKHASLRDKKVPYGVVIISTPNSTFGIGEWFYKMFTDENNGYTKFVIHYSDAPFADEEWKSRLKKMIDPNAWEQEMELKFTVASDSLITNDIAMELQNIHVEPKNKEERIYTYGDKVYKGLWKYYVDLNYINDKRFFLIGIDTASISGGKSESVIEVFEYLNGRIVQVAEFNGKIPLTNLKDEIINISKKFPNCLICLENNSYAQKLAEELGVELSSRMYRVREIKNGKITVKNVPGITTTKTTRNTIIDQLYSYLTEKKIVIKSTSLAMAIMSIKRDLKIIPDSVMATGMILYTLHIDKEIVNYFTSDVSYAFYDEIELNEDKTKLILGDNLSKQLGDNFELEGNFETGFTVKYRNEFIESLIGNKRKKNDEVDFMNIFFDEGT